MDLNKNNIKKILGIITFTLVLLALLLNMGAVGAWLAFMWGILFPFVLGGAIAFILNLPMAAIEKKLFSKAKNKKAARPVSLVLSILCVFAVIAIVIVVVIPQLGKTFDSISEGMATFLPEAQKWLEELFRDWDMVETYIESLEFDWTGWLEAVKDFALSGAGSVVSYTMSATMKVMSEDSPGIFPGAGGGKNVPYLCAVPQNLFQIYHRPVSGSIDTGLHVRGQYDHIPTALRIVGGRADCVYRADSHGRSLYRMRGGRIPDSDGQSHAGSIFCHPVPGAAADRRQPDLSPCGGKFRGTSFHMGAVCGDRGRKTYGNSGNAGIHSPHVRAVRIVPGMGEPEKQTVDTEKLFYTDFT